MEHTFIERNAFPSKVRGVFIPGLSLNVAIQTKLAVTGAMNRASWVTEIVLLKKAFGYGYVGTRDTSVFYVTTHDMLDFREKPNAWSNHIKKVKAQLRKIGAADVADVLDLDSTAVAKVTYTGDEEVKAKASYLFR